MAAMGRRIWSLLLIALIVAAALQTADCKKKKKKTVVVEEAPEEEAEVAPPATKKAAAAAATTTAAAAAADEDSEALAEAAPAAEDEAPADEEAEAPPAKTKSKKAAAAAAAAADDDAEAASDEAPEDAETEPAPAKKSAKKASAEEEEERAEPAAKEEASEEETAEPDAAAAVTEDGSANAADLDIDPATAAGGKAAVAEKPSTVPGSVTDAGPLAWRSHNMSREDVDPNGPCKRDIKIHCQGVEPGNAVLSLCLTFHVKNENSGNEVAGPPVSKKCRKDIRAFRAEMYKDLSMDKAMETSCKTAIAKFCDDDFLYPEPGNIVACLREVNQVEKLADACRQEILRAQLEAAEDFKMDPQLNELCSGEVERLCKGVEPGEGRVQECLREHRSKLAWDCQAELFRQEVENTDDIRLNVRLFQACLNDQRKFCADVRYGDARVKDCLEEHRLDSDFSPGCKTEFEKMMARRSTDFRLDANLRKYCKADISEICYPDAEDISDVANYDAKVIECLQDYREELKDGECKAQVHKLTARAAEDIRFDRPLADACHEDRSTICRDVPDGMAQVFLCLQEHMDRLKDSCRTAVFEQLVRMAEDIDFKFPMKRACVAELNKFCKDIPHGHAARVKCLQENIDNADMAEDCRKEVKRDMIRSAQDYRLNYRLHRACLPEIQKHCAHSCDLVGTNGSVTCGGTVLKCLQDLGDSLESASCRQEVQSFSLLEAKDPLSLNLPLQRACRADLVKLCPDVSRDHTRSLTCLRGKRDQLSKECKKEEMRFSIMEATDIRLTPTLMNACGQELQSFCRNIPPTGGHSFKCLQSHLEEVGMGAACKGEVNLQEARQAGNYRLDVRLRKECQADASNLCEGVDAGQEGHALVLKCMMGKYKSLAPSCQSEVSYAVRMALFQYRRGADLTSPCDSAVKQLCSQPPRARPKEINGAVIGAYGQCLVAQKSNRLPDECLVLVKLAAKEGAHAGGVVDAAKLEETLMKLKELQDAGETLELPRKHSQLVVSGWIAFAALVAVVVVAVAVGFAVYHKYFSPTRNYTLVVKSAPPGTVGV